MERKIRVIESDLLRLAHEYGVQNVTELGEMIRQGKYHEDEAFEDYFEFDNLESERDKQDVIQGFRDFMGFVEANVMSG